MNEHLKRVEVGKLLARLELFSGLDPEELASVVALTRARLFQTGDVVVRQGERAESAFAVAYCRLKVVSTSESGKELGLSLMGAGEVFGELSILDGGTRSATVVAVEPTLLLEVDRAKFHALLRRSPEVSFKLLGVLAKRLRRLSERTEDAALDVYTRLAKRLLQLAEEYGKPQDDGTIRVALSLDQRELGELLGTTRESVNKNLRRLRAQGIAEWSKDHVVVRDLSRLRKAAAPG